MGQAKKPNPENIAPFLQPIKSLQALLETFNHQGVIIGGIAASLLGTPRFTADIDVVFLLGFDDIPRLLDEAAKFGIEPRISDSIEFAKQSRVLLLRHIISGIDIDLSLGILPFEVEMVERSSLIEVGTVLIRLPTPEDLIIMKAIANRPKDISDIQAISDSNPNLDRDHIRFWIDQFGEALDKPNLWEDISNLFS
jgi:hypothetical protein